MLLKFAEAVSVVTAVPFAILHALRPMMRAYFPIMGNYPFFTRSIVVVA